MGPGQGRPRRRDPARSVRCGARDAHREHGLGRAGRGRRDSRGRRACRHRRGSPRERHRGSGAVASCRGARAAACGAVLSGGLGRRADGFRPRGGARRRHPGSGDPLPAPHGRASGPYGPAVRRRSRAGAQGHAAARAPDRIRPGARRRRHHGARERQALSRGPRRRRGQCLRALRPGVRAGGRCQRPPDRASHG